MEDYRLEQSGQEVQHILNGAAMQTDLTAENERAELAEQTLQGNIDAEALARENADGVLQGHIDAEETRAKAAEKQNADDIDAIEEKIPTQASSSNQLADKDYVEDLVSTSSATFRGTFNLVSDLHLTVDASHADIAAALGNAIAGADNNDFAFVMIPTSVDTPNEIARIERYKFNGTAWAFEFVLNNSGFTADQWAAINSGITSALVTKLGALPTASELATALLAKQDKLTFDQAPTPSSTNPVTSGGVYTAIDDEKGARVNADAALQQAIEAILVLIPSAATALNQLADKAFVNSSIATATATFRGTFNLVSDLQLTVDATHADIAAALLNAISTADNNDYAFVQIPTSVDTPTEIRVTERYKFNGTAWSYEYDLNNSGFTADQWAAINSGITALLVTKLSNLPNATELATLFAGKQNVLSFDNAPAEGSNNPVKSGGLYDLFAAIDAKMPTGASANNKLVAEDRLAAYVGGIIGALDATFNLTSTDGHVTLRMTQTDGVIASLQILTSDIASASALATLGGLVSTNADDIAALQALYNALQQSAPQIIEPSDTWPVASPSDTVIYRVIDRVNTPPQYYSDYMWNGTTMVLMATYNNAIDPLPKKDSQNLVTSGGVFNNMGALDVSELNATENPHHLAQYVDLSAALAAVPTDYQKGGMSINFVQSSDNKYVQFRLMSDNFNTTESNWQGVDKEPTVGSNNLVESEGVAIALYGDKNVVEVDDDYVDHYITKYLDNPIVLKSGDTLFYKATAPITPFMLYSGNTRLLETSIPIANQYYEYIAQSDVIIDKIALYSSGGGHTTDTFTLYSKEGLATKKDVEELQNAINNEVENRQESEAEIQKEIDEFSSLFGSEEKETEYTGSDAVSGFMNTSGVLESDYYHISKTIKAGDIIKCKCTVGSNIRAFVIVKENGVVSRVYDAESWGTVHSYDIQTTITEEEDNGTVYVNSIYSGDNIGLKIIANEKVLDGKNIKKSSAPISILEGKIYNLYNKETDTPNAYIDVNTGEVVPNTGMGRSVSDFIPVEYNKDYTLPVYANAMFANVDRIACYDSNKEFVKNIQGTLSQDVILTIRINDDRIKYIRTTIMRSTRTRDPWLRDADLMMVVNSATYPDRYYPYGAIVTYEGELSSSMNAMYNPLFGKTVVFDGDSICNAGEADDEKGWAYRIGMKNNMLWKNYGIDGGTFTNLGIGNHVISETVFEPDTPDYIIIDGGTNDADRCGSILNGAAPQAFGSYSEAGYTDSFTNDTFCGAIEYLFKKLVTTYPKAKIGIIIAQKMSHFNSSTHEIYDDTNEDFTKEHNNRRAYFEVLMKLCKKWGISYINLWDESKLNPWLHYQWDSENSLYVDGQHLKPAGYEIITPIIEDWMKTL